MNDQISQQESGQPDTISASPTVRQNALATWVSRLNIWQMTMALVILIFVWQWLNTQYQISNLQQEVARRLTEVESNNKASQILITQQQEVLRELSGKLAMQEAHYAETQNQSAGLQSLYQELSGSRDDMVLAQVEQLLLIAGQQLQLAANVKAALIAMQQADDYLKRMDRASLSKIRQRIAQDMDKLRALPNVDIPGLNVRLDSLVSAVDNLNLQQDLPLTRTVDTLQATPDTSTWQSLIREIWHDARHLIRIENTQKSELPLLSPAQGFFLRENLKLRLLSARTALLTRDEVSYKQDLTQAQDWMQRYFDVQSGTGAQALATLQKLREPGIRIELPDISDSLESVRAYRASREKTVR